MSPGGLKRRRAPVQDRSRETVGALLEAAAQVFERHGYAAGTTNRIAARAGVSIGSLYQYFPNKQSILVALTEGHIDDGYRLLGPLAESFAADPPPLRQGLERLVGTMVELHAAAPRLHRVLFEECPRPPALQERIDAAQRDAVTAVAAWLRIRPELAAPDPELAAEMIVGVVEGVVHGVVIHPREGRDPAVYAGETVEMLCRYLAGVGEKP